MSKYSVSKIVIVILALIAIVFAGFIFYGYGSIFPEIPEPGSEKGRFIKYLSCVMAMCSGHVVDGDICRSAEVIDVGWLEHEEGLPVESCHSLCNEIKSNFGMKERYCGDEYKIRFVFQDNVNLTRKEDIRNYGNWESLIHWCCDRSFMGELDSFTDCEMSSHAYADECGRIWIDDNYASLPEHCKSYKEHSMFGGVWKEYSWCFFESGTEFDIWARSRRETHSWWFFAWERCDQFFGDVHKCPELVICSAS